MTFATKAFTGFYSEAMRTAQRQLDDVELRLFVVLSTFSGANGMTDVSQRRLADELGWRVEDTAKRLSALEERGAIVIVRRGARDPLSGRNLPNVYAVHPDLVLAPMGVDALKSIYGENWIGLFSQSLIQFSAQNWHDQESNRIKRQNQSKNQNPESQDTESARARAKGQKDPSTEKGQGQKKTPNSADGATHLKKPLTSALEEMAAQRLKQQTGNMPIHIARALVESYGVGECETALALFRQRQQEVPIGNPGGWVRKVLEASARTAPDNPL